MTRSPKHLKTKRALLGLIFIAAYLPVYMAVSSISENQISKRSALALDHALYALEQKDEMAVIDWGKSMANENDILAFRLTAGSKISAEGGNLQYLPAKQSAIPLYGGTRFITLTRHREGIDELKLELVARGEMSRVFLWGSLSAALCLITALIAGNHFFRETDRNPETPLDRPKAKPAIENLIRHEVSAEVDQEEAILLVDHGLLIQQATEKAAQLLKIKSSALLQVHLLDLTPSPQLLEALADKREIELENAFLPNRRISVLAKPGSNGTFLYLTERSGRSEA